MLRTEMNPTFTSNTSLNSRSMSSHQLLNQLTRQQRVSETSASSTTIDSSTLVNRDQLEVVTSADSTPVQTPTTLGKFPIQQDKNVMAIIEEHAIDPKTVDPQEAMVESVHSKTASLADKLSRSFLDLTQGSQDRLARWKNKLQQYSQQQRRSSEKEPPNSARLVKLRLMVGWLYTSIIYL